MRAICPACGEIVEAGRSCPRDGTPAAVADDPLLGEPVGSYRVARLLGRGGMGSVYLGVQPAIGARVALKVLDARDAEATARFYAEACAANLVHHEAIVQVLDLTALPDGRPCIVMEYVEGQSLAQVFAAGRQPLDRVRRIGGELLAALAAAHAAGIVHRDLKPGNVLITPTGRARVLDFGIAKLAPETGIAVARTGTGALLGTPLYLSPEQARGRPADARSDLYAVGVILYEGAAGAPPFGGATVYDLLRAHAEETPPPPRSRCPELPAELEAVILRALEKDPARRFQTAAEMAAALAGAPPPANPLASTAVAAAAVAAPTPAHAAASPPTTGSPAPARSWAALAGAAAVVLAVAAAVALPRLLALRSPAPTLPSVSLPGTPELRPSAPRLPPELAEARSLPRPADESHLDVDATLITATAAARDRVADAALVRFYAKAVRADGTADLARGDVFFEFRSPARSAAPADPPGTERACLVSVSYSDLGRVASPFPDERCDEVILGPPRCTVKQVWSRAVETGAAANGIAHVTYTRETSGRLKGRPVWSFHMGDLERVFADDCK